MILGGSISELLRRDLIMQALILASESPRRRELLTQAGFEFTVEVAHAQEISEGRPEDVTVQNAVLKAQAVQKHQPGRMVLGADTVVYVDGRVFGKPKDEQDAKRMLEALNGRWHQVYTGVAMTDPEGGLHTAYAVTDVHFVDMTEEEIISYIATGEPFGKAGSYAIQSRAGYFVDRIEGSFSNVIGLPLTTVRELLKEITG